MTEYYNMNYGGKEVQVESAVRDEEGYSIKGCYAKKNEIKDGVLTINTNGGSTLGTFSANQSTNQTVTLPNGSVQLLNQSVTFVSDNTYEEFPYRASVTVSGISSSTYAEVTYSEEQATSLNFATFCDTATNVIYLYSRTNVGTVAIPTISIGMDYSDITIDATPTSGSGNAVSSGGVYTALATKQDTLTFDNTPTDGSSNPVTSGGIFTALGTKADSSVLGNYVTLGTTQTIAGLKTFSGNVNINGSMIMPYGYIYTERDNNNARNSATLRADNGSNWSGLYSYLADNGTHWVSAVAYINGSIQANTILTDAVTTGTGTVASGCSLIDGVAIKWYKKGQMCTVCFPIKVSSSYTGTYTQYLLATGLPASIISEYPYGCSAVTVDNQENNGGAMAFVNTVGHLYLLVRHQSMAGKGVVGSVTYITA